MIIQVVFSYSVKSYLIPDTTRKEIAHMKALIILTVFLASATGMSEATAPLRSYYRTTYHDKKADAAMLCGIALSFIL